MSIDYSEGAAIEGRVRELIESAEDLRSEAAIASKHYGDWSTKYHLCPERANLVRHLDFTGLDVLELGAGMGAVSRYLAERAKHLTVVEGTPSRYAALAARLRDLPNWDGIVANIQDVKMDRKFDVVCVIGVLEYAEMFLTPGPGKSPFHYFLQIARSFLREDGALIIAIENKLGIKYWSGAAEDHLGTIYDGIVGYPRHKKTPRTFSRKELKGLLTATGLGTIDEYYPFPDYKIPTSVMSKTFVEAEPGLAADIATYQDFENYSLPRFRAFPDLLAAQSISSAGLLPELSNSFLFLATANADSGIRKRLMGDPALAWHYAFNRIVPTRTRFTESPKGIRVAREVLASPSLKEKTFVLPNGLKVHWRKPKVEIASPGIKLRTLLASHAYFGAWETYEAALHDFLQWSLDHWKGSGEGLDATLMNACLAEEKGEYQLFDLEWHLEGTLDPSWLVFRNIHSLVRDRALFSEEAPFKSLGELYERACRRLGILPELERNLDSEAQLQAGVSREPIVAHHRGVYAHDFGACFRARAYPRHPAWETEARDRAEEHETQVSDPTFRLLRKTTHTLKRLPWLHRSLNTTAAKLVALSESMRAARALKASDRGLVYDFPVPSDGKFPRDFLQLEIEGDFRNVTEARACFFFQGEYGQRSRLVARLPLDRRDRIVHLMRVKSEILGVRLELDADVGSVTIKSAKIRPKSKWQVAGLLGARQAERMLYEPSSAVRLIAGAASAARQAGPKALKSFLHEQVVADRFAMIDQYAWWVENYDTLTEQDREAIRRHLASLSYRPLISILMPTYNTDERWLRSAIESVTHQLYPHWELCIADDLSTLPHVRRVLEEYAAKDSRIKLVFRTKNGHIAAASNSALELASGDFIALLDHDDALAEHALYLVVEELNRHPDADLIYGDEDKIDIHGRRCDPHFKTEWNPDLMYSINLITHLAVFRAELVRRVGGFRPGFDGSQDYDLMLNVVDHSAPERIRHIPHILYHWRVIPGSTAKGPSEKDYAHEAARRAIRSHLDRIGVEAEVVPGHFPYHHRVIYPLPPAPPLVSVIICTRDRKDLLERIVSGVLEQTKYSRLELIIVDNQSVQDSTLSFLESLKRDSRVKIIRHEGPFNFAGLNNLAVREATGEVLAFLNNDLEVIDGGWLEEMVRFALQPAVGAVGAKLLFRDGRIQHGGILLGVGGIAEHAHRGLEGEHPGYHGRACIVQAFSAVTGACLVTRRELFNEMGGFDQEHLAIAYNDVDYCLRLRARGYRVLWTPHAVLHHLESASRGSDETPENRARLETESAYMRAQWGEVLRADPYYNPNMTSERPDFSPAFPPRVQKPWRREATPVIARLPIAPSSSQ